MICPYCSLLCDAENSQEIRCDRRESSLIRLESLHALRLNSQSNAFQSQCEVEAVLALRAAKRILVTGRIASVATARAAVAFASKFNATIDCAESGHVFKNIQAIQRSGLNSVSLAEARDHSDFFIVVGHDSMLAACPRMPDALFGGKQDRQIALLLGDFSDASVERWKSAGFETWFVRCDLESVPKALSQWSTWSHSHPISVSDAPTMSTQSTGPLFEKMAHAKYTTVVWSAECLPMNHADLWVERMLQWIANRNETTRCAALPWTSLDGTFHQVCTWLTGFPGRVAFRNGIPEYDPTRHSCEEWIARSTQGPSDSIVVLIDETIALAPFLNASLREAATHYVSIELTSASSRFPTAIAGAEMISDMFRADQTLLARVSPPLKHGVRKNSGAEWLKRLSS